MEAFDGGRRPDWPVGGQGVVASKGASVVDGGDSNLLFHSFCSLENDLYAAKL